MGIYNNWSGLNGWSLKLLSGVAVTSGWWNMCYRCKFIRSGINQTNEFETSTLLSNFAYRKHFCGTNCVLSRSQRLWSILGNWLVKQPVWRHNLLWRQNWLTFSCCCPPGLCGLDKVIPDWIQVQSFVSVQIWSSFPDVNSFKDFPWQILWFLFKDLNGIPVYVVSVITPCDMLVYSRFGSGSPWFMFSQPFFQLSASLSNVNRLVIQTREIIDCPWLFQLVRFILWWNKVCRNVLYSLKAVGTPAVLKALRNFSEDLSMYGNVTVGVLFLDTGSFPWVVAFSRLLLALKNAQFLRIDQSLWDRLRTRLVPRKRFR